MDSYRPSSFDILRRFVLENPPKESAEDEDELLPHKIAIEDSIDKSQQLHDPTLKDIPRFYFKNSKSEGKGSSRQTDEAVSLMKKMAQQQFIQKRASLMLDSDELDRIWVLLLQNASPPVVEGDEKVDTYVCVCVLLTLHAISNSTSVL